MNENKRIFNENKTKELSNDDIDLKLGYLKNDTLEIIHPEVLGQEEEGHYITIAEYDNGGKDVEWVIDKPFIQHQDSYVEEEPIQIYIRYTDSELKHLKNEIELNKLKQLLAESDYKAIKYAEGYYTEEEYKPIREYRESLREQIRDIIDNKDKKEG